jgi:hypothetical protein
LTTDNEEEIPQQQHAAVAFAKKQTKENKSMVGASYHQLSFYGSLTYEIQEVSSASRFLQETSWLQGVYVANLC